MNFIEDTIFPHGSDSLRKECNIALKTSPRGSKTTFLPIKLQQSIIQAAMYAASANSQKQTGTDIRSEDAGPAALSSGQGIGLTRPRHSACENATHVHRLFRKRGYRGGIRIRVRRDYRRGFGRRRAISVSAA